MRIKSLILSAMTIVAMSLYPAIYSSAEESEEETELVVEDTIILYEDFDNYDVGKWVAFGGGKIFLDNTVSHSGDQSLKITDRSNSYEGPSLSCDNLLSPGEAYMFNGWVYHESDNVEKISWTAKLRDEFGASSFVQLASADIEPGTWTNLANSVQIPEEAVECMIYFEC
ncbi:MAG: carbohydrate binding domain-containing protein [Ruminococcus sp.]|nr:carbohydrate binding domain-containing protein [Ruminococcus sp.]